MATECSVCYGDCACRTLSCGHEFCGTCIKSWYLKGTGSGCPMCRRPINFRGFHKLRREWDEAAWETKCSDVFGEFIDTAFRDFQDLAEDYGSEDAMRILVQELKDGDRTYKFLRSYEVDPAEICYFLIDEPQYLSDRRVYNYYVDDPTLAFETRYPGLRVRTPLSVLC